MNKEKMRLEDLSDEELLILFRNGMKEARDVLSVRYFHMKDSLIERVSPEAMRLLDVWDLNESFFMAYLKSESSFKVDLELKFLSLVCMNLRNELINLLRKVHAQFDGFYIISMDEPVDLDGKDASVISKQDVDYGRDVGESAGYSNLVFALEELRERAIKVDAIAERLMLLVYGGYSIPEACKMLKISAAKGRRIVKIMQEEMREYTRECESPDVFVSIKGPAKKSRAPKAAPKKKKRGRPRKKKKYHKLY